MNFIIMKPISFQLMASNKLARDQVPALNFASQVKGKKLVIDYFISKILLDFVDSNELYHVGMEKGNNSDISQLVEIAYSFFIFAVEQLSLITEVDVLK